MHRTTGFAILRAGILECNVSIERKFKRTILDSGSVCRVGQTLLSVRYDIATPHADRQE